MCLMPFFFSHFSQISICWSLYLVLGSLIEVLLAACLYVCMSVCLSDRTTHVSKITRSNVTKFSVRVTCDRFSFLLWWQCITLCTSVFVDDVTFSHSGDSGPESKTTRMFRPVRHVAAPSELLSAIAGLLQIALDHMAVFDCCSRQCMSCNIYVHCRTFGKDDLRAYIILLLVCKCGTFYWPLLYKMPIYQSSVSSVGAVLVGANVIELMSLVFLYYIKVKVFCSSRSVVLVSFTKGLEAGVSLHGQSNDRPTVTFPSAEHHRRPLAVARVLTTSS